MGLSFHYEKSGQATLAEAILLYGSHNDGRYATIHKVAIGPDGKPQIQCGTALDMNCLDALLRKIGGSQRKAGVLPANVLSVGQNQIVWWVPPGKRQHFFDTRAEAGRKTVGKRSAVCPHPGLVFAAVGQDLRCFAVTGDQRPDAETRLYHAPYMNVWVSGKVCVGSMAKPPESAAETIAAWTNAWFDSYFSHPNHEKVVKYRGGIHALSLALLDGKFDTFPERVLLPHQPGITVSDLINSLEEKSQ